MRAPVRSRITGAGARLVQKGDKVIEVAYGKLPAEEARNASTTVVLPDDANQIKTVA